MTILNQDLSDLSYRRQVTEFENALVAKLQQEQLLPATTTPPQVAPSHAAPTNANGISPDSRNDIDSMMNEAPLPKKRRAHR